MAESPRADMSQRDQIRSRKPHAASDVDPHKRHPVMVSAALVVLMGATVFALPRMTPAWETSLFRSVNEAPGFLFPALWIIMQLGNLLVAPLAAGIAATCRRPRLGVELAIAGAAAWVVAKMVKAWVGRGRPQALLDDVAMRETTDQDYGFVSGHTAVAFALAVVLLPILPRPLKVTVLVLATLVGIGRIYVGAHLPLDVVGGAALGIALGGLTSLTMKRDSDPLASHPSTGGARA